MKPKLAYPNFTDSITPNAPFNTKKWMLAMQDILSRVNYGIEYSKAFDLVTQEWKTVEKRQFKEWLKFYQERTHMKYKMAQKMYYENSSPGYFIPLDVKKDINDAVVPPELQGGARRDHDEVQQHAKMSEAEKRRIVEQHRKKIIARLQAARKLLTSDDGKNFAGEDWSRLLDALNELEKQFHTINKVSVSNRLYEDLIVRQANILSNQGFVKSSAFLVKIAQGLPGAGLPADPNKAQVDGGAMGNNTPSLAPAPDAAVSEKDKGMRRFLNLLNGKGGEDESDAEDDESDAEDQNDVEIEDQNDADDSLVVEAQAADIPGLNAKPAPDAEPVEKALVELPVEIADVKTDAPADIEVSEKDIPQKDVQEETIEGSHRDFDSLIDAAFSSLKVSDIVHRLEELSRIFKNREIARQLSVVDMMMDKLGLSSFFPTLAEATRSALESNQYCLTRIEEVRNKLSGAMDTAGKSTHDMGQQHSINNQPAEIDLMGPETKDSAEDDGILSRVKDSLNVQEEKEKKKKEIRKSIDEKDLFEGKGDKEKSNVEGIDQDLAGQPAPAIKPAIPVAPSVPTPPTK